MNTSGKNEKIPNDIDALGEKIHFRKLLQKSSASTLGKNEEKLTELRNLGSEIWKGVDLDNYLKEAKDWE
jgi:hypothetical protein